MNLVS